MESHFLQYLYITFIFGGIGIFVWFISKDAKKFMRSENSLTRIHNSIVYMLNYINENMLDNGRFIYIRNLKGKNKANFEAYSTTHHARMLYSLSLCEKDLKIEGLADSAKKADVYEKQLKDLIEELKASGETLNEKFEVCKDGQPIKMIRKLTDEEIDLAVQASARIVKVGMFMGRYPAEMSGGQQQRVAIARTLAPKPKVLFMDEPLSNLDAKLRLGMRYELQRLHVTTGATFVYVTHDQMEAMTLATKICLMNNGVLQQYDAPLDVYLRPNNLFVADFVGNPSINFIEAVGKQNKDGNMSFSVLEGKNVKFVLKETIDIDQWQKRRDHNVASEVKDKENKDEVFNPRIDRINENVTETKNASAYSNEDFILGVRPEYIKISKDGKFKAEVYGAMPTGMESTVKLRIGDFLLTSVVFGSVTFPIGEEVCFDIVGDGILLFDRKSGKLITSGEVIVQ